MHIKNFAKFLIEEKNDFKNDFKNFYGKIPSKLILTFRILDVFGNKKTIHVSVEENEEESLKYILFPGWGSDGTAQSISYLGIQSKVPNSFKKINDIKELISILEDVLRSESVKIDSIEKN